MLAISNHITKIIHPHKGRGATEVYIGLTNLAEHLIQQTSIQLKNICDKVNHNADQLQSQLLSIKKILSECDLLSQKATLTKQANKWFACSEPHAIDREYQIFNNLLDIYSDQSKDFNVMPSSIAQKTAKMELGGIINHQKLKTKDKIRAPMVELENIFIELKKQQTPAYTQKDLTAYRFADYPTFKGYWAELMLQPTGSERNMRAKAAFEDVLKTEPALAEWLERYHGFFAKMHQLWNDGGRLTVARLQK